MKILAISDVPSKLLWDESVRKRLEGIDLILSCGDLPKKYLEYLTNFTTVPILYVHGNHDGSYRENEPGGCICVDDSVYVWRGLRIMGLGGSIRYNREETFQYTEKEMRRRMLHYHEFIQGVPMADGAPPLIFPGELEQRRERERRISGIPVPLSTLETLQNLKAHYSLKTDLI